ncbi:OmpH family outer membrane protein [Acetonema longum]|uniref:Outer membrane chaperone Skp (OmpH) n=1 Tax=Acetonema longum DSM 6540 TaxID=1009370 RepID=F7NM42_9FIRM|nr:OmpH family outer membrane protein [Acetonema longum]EGO62897.1 outer membrane chaperone Skp (OmpH) [Acetonema longum DSM 6540]
MKKSMICLMTIVMVMLGANVGVAAPQSGSQSSSIGVIDVDRIMAESPKVKALQEQLNQVAKSYTDQLEAEKPNLSPEEYEKKREIVYQKFLRKKQELEKQVDQSLKQALEAVAKTKKLSLILYKNSVAFGGTDITSEVIKVMK